MPAIGVETPLTGMRWITFTSTVLIALWLFVLHEVILVNKDTSYFLMLLTTRVGGLGVNLTGANRVVIYDPDWNPATDTQARERAWRIGQQQSVTVYRLITAGTIEEKMYHRQIFKQFLCNKVLKDPRQRRFFKANDLYELFTLRETDVEGSTETGAIFAGTGSEVKLDLTKTYKHRRIDPKQSARPPLETYSRKKAQRKKKLVEESVKELEVKNKSVEEVNFSDEKIEHMKKLAQMLSQKIIQNTSPDKSNSVVESKSSRRNSEDKVMVDDETCINKVDLSVPSTSSSSDSPPMITDWETQKVTKKTQRNEDNDAIQTKSNTLLTNNNNDSKAFTHSSDNKRQKHKSKRKEKKKKKVKDAEFEGEVVPHLVKAGTSTSKPEKENPEDNEKYATQDEYVLLKLFARSGLQTALKHDTIMEGGPADYALVESEAEKVAQQAVARLKESRRECWEASSGIPNFTGLNGLRNVQARMRLATKKSAVCQMPLCDLREQIRKRNGIVDAKDSEISLVKDIREFVSDHGGTVHTTQLINRFEGRLPEGSSPLFKSLLEKICTFYRAPDKLGYWTLKEDFNW